MNRLPAICALLAVSAFAEKLPLPDGSSVELPPPLSKEEAQAQDEKERAEHEAAIARLPQFDEERMEFLLTTLRKTKYPISFDALRDKLGGPDALVWCCSRDKLHQTFVKRTSTYRVARSTPEGGDYVLVVDFDDMPIDRTPDSHSVCRARLCYESPFGWRFTAESMDDFLRAGSPEKEPNQTPEPTPMAVTPPAAQEPRQP